MEKRNLYQRICAIMGDAGTLAKEGKNIAQNYKYLRETDVADLMRGLCAKHGVAIIPNVVEYARSEEGRTKSGNPIWLSRVKVAYELVNSEEPADRISTICFGEAYDGADKGLYKASTNAHKYFLVRTFSLGSDDDVENDKQGRNDPPYTRQPQPPTPPSPAPKLHYYNVSKAPDQALAAEWLEKKGAEYDPHLKVYVCMVELRGCDKYRVNSPTDPAPDPLTIQAQQEPKKVELPKLLTADELNGEFQEASAQHEQISDVEILNKETGEVIPQSALAVETKAKIEKLKKNLQPKGDNNHAS